MARDPQAELSPNCRRAARRRLNPPVIVSPYPFETISERRDAAIAAWFADLFHLYDLDPNSETRWEQVAWALAFDLFPKFGTVGKSNVGAPGTRAGVLQLFHKFQSYQPRAKGSKYTNFLSDHPA